VNTVRMRHRSGAIRRGAVATPVRRYLRIKVRPRHARRVTVSYGTIVNPGLRAVSGHISRVLGDPQSPSGVILDQRQGIHKGSILSAQPSGKLPQGLLAHVTSIRSGTGGTIVGIRPAGIYEVAPNMSFDTPLSASGGASSSQAFTCQTSGPGLHPYVRVSNISASGGWTTSRVAFVEIKTGATVDLHFHAAAGVDVTASARLSCSIPLPSLAIQGMAGPIPIYGAIKPGASAEVAAGAKMSAEGSTDVTLGTHISGVPLSAQPQLSFDSPKFDFKSELFATAKASLSLNAEVGIGVANAANIHISLGNALEFGAAPGNCTWDLNLGSFSAGGQLGPFSISTPSTPPLYHRNLWHRACGASAPPPAPPPPPPPPPPITLPLARATMSWDSESDIDLYTWDQTGRLISYYERLGIPEAELIEDVIPSFGEYLHPPEIFQETGSPNRTYTFGICDFHGEGGDVTLDVVDPGGGHRTFHETFFEAGESTVITTSPNGQGYDPGFGWCHYIE
jgi:hypothetical protein